MIVNVYFFHLQNARPIGISKSKNSLENIRTVPRPSQQTASTGKQILNTIYQRSGLFP